MKKKNYNRNPKGLNGLTLRSNEEIQEIINKFPQNWTKKDFRGETKQNTKKILTRKETERTGLIFGNFRNKDKYTKNKMRCSICKNLKYSHEYPDDKNASNQKRSNCKECDLKRNFKFYNNNINYFKEYEENRWSKIKKNKDLLEKKRERDREYYLTIKDNY